MRSLTFLLEPVKKYGTALWVPFLIPDGNIHPTPQKIRITRWAKTLEIPPEQFLVHLIKPLPQNFTDRYQIPTPLFTNYVPPPEGFPPWRIAGSLTDPVQGYSRLRNVRVYGIQDVPTSWCYAILGPNVNSTETTPFLAGIEQHL